MKPVNRLTISDFQRHPVWTFVPETRSRDETWMKPVRKLPVDDLDGKVVGSQVRLASGRLIWAMIGNVDVHNAKATKHFIGLSLGSVAHGSTSPVITISTTTAEVRKGSRMH